MILASIVFEILAA